MSNGARKKAVLGTLVDRAVCMPYAKPQVLRRGRRQLEMYEDPKVRDCFVSSEMVQWGAQNPGRREIKEATTPDSSSGRTT